MSTHQFDEEFSSLTCTLLCENSMLDFTSSLGVLQPPPAICTDVTLNVYIFHWITFIFVSVLIVHLFAFAYPLLFSDNVIFKLYAVLYDYIIFNLHRLYTRIHRCVCLVWI